MCFLINIYLDDHQSTLKYLKNTKISLNNVLIMTGDFNIRDLVIDFVFLYFYIEEFNNHSIFSKLHSPSNHAFLLVYIIIEEKFIQKKKFTIIKNSKEEKEFMKELKDKNRQNQNIQPLQS